MCHATLRARPVRGGEGAHASSALGYGTRAGRDLAEAARTTCS